MSDLDPPPPLEPHIAALLEAERSRPDDPEAIARLCARVALTTQLPSAGRGGHGDGGGGALPSAGGTAAGVVPAKIAGLLLGAFAAGVGVGAMGHATLSRPAPVVVTAPVAPASASSTTWPTPVAEPAASLSATTLAASAASTPSPAAPPPTRGARTVGHDRDTSLALERAWIEQARMALARGSPGDALAALDAHARSFPAGRLAEEREALAIQALSAAGRADEAAARARSFRQRWPGSVFLPLVDRAAPENR
jgi:hypothetical protein